jgi:hypothetical protein
MGVIMTEKGNDRTGTGIVAPKHYISEFPFIILSLWLLSH